MRFLRMLFVSCTSFACVSTLGTQAFAQSKAGPAEANKKLVLEFYRVVWEPKNSDPVPQFIAEDYIEHNPRGKNGRDNLITDQKLVSQSAKPADTLRNPPAMIIAEGDLVTLVFKRMREDPKDKSKYEVFGFDTFRIKDGKIVEHWDAATR